MEIFVIAVILLAIPAAVALRVRRERREARALPAASPPTPVPVPPARPRVPSLGERLIAVGIPHANAYEGMGSYGIEVEAVKSSDGRWSWCPFASYSPEWLGRLFTVGIEDVRLSEKLVPPSAYCDHCDDVMGMALYEVVKKPVPPGELDQGWTEPRSLGRWCRRCGLLQEEGRPESRVLGTLWTGVANMFQLVHALESDDAKRKLAEAKLACVDEELGDVEMRRDRLLHERMRIRDELGLLKGPPNRDRFMEDPRTAALEDAPDRRTKALPALTE